MAAVDTATNLAEIHDAWHGLKDAGDWLICGLDGNTLVLEGQGKGGIDELRSKFDDSKVQWGALTVIAVDELSGVETRSRNRVSVSFFGASVGAMRKSQLAQHKGAVKDQVFPGNSATLDLHEPADLTTQDIVEKLTKKSHKPNSLDFGGGVSVQL
mmetsp:Transcript_22714/g.63864  ORF Transcript_22714/g.63864 Transcript_22714/m.63864 type:complete len:156 (+) Transcript_22714:81-548(+)|eukprot:CAMPEP_0119132430 /NCGR_PEP_ID=MMETSP1310-20130426/11835_1 /TAXON_ID=464262 /ORGANISM="Genus nov. species nov., Strain RCC2339" /LENGTH=155 /DNA_ID=CAMNT_0007123063 /DNA_START=77 /DNA_END=544 /DNA_ORIENTATION=+